MTIKPIETEYDGYRFRSRLEARWAVFFNEIGAEYNYEYEGFDLDGIRYLPDFWLPQMNSWFEIKGQEPNDQELDKAKRLCLGTGKTVFICVGEPHNPIYQVCFVKEGVYRTFNSKEAKGPIGWTRIDDGSITIGRWSLYRGDQVNDPILLTGYNAARYARFER